MLKNVFFCLLFLIPSSTYASGIAFFKGVDKGKPYNLSLEYLNRNTSRINMDGNRDVDSYLLINNKSAQLVSSYQGNTLVMDLASVNQMAQSLGVVDLLGMGSENLQIHVISMEPTGKKEKVAGIEGEVYKLTWSRNKVKQQDFLVMSGDSRVREYTEVWVDAIDAINTSSPSISIRGNALRDRIIREKIGILRLGKSFRLASVQSKALSPARFSAPNTSFTIQGLGGLLDSM